MLLWMRQILILPSHLQVQVLWPWDDMLRLVLDMAEDHPISTDIVYHQPQHRSALSTWQQYEETVESYHPAKNRFNNIYQNI